ncbi:ATP-binding protein [Mycolicibacterium phocaicum]|uniref:ATP-binding protein n=1 Tax=Mycolicibacterium phocaicum TaxID=319706 RepID=UPI00092A7F1E|nr:ATP-binding protein [Mycolicibacterium phocaicum]UCZ62876.1 ATP-binding protein [Mycolicibacterium phocaicum]SHV84799.1 molecular chaperone of HSP90 family [Mycobacteroides abscessus subsp. abscessus]
MSAPQQQNFRVDLGGIIALLSKNLYSSPGVYVRELIQNAMDAVVARDALGSPAPRIITISPYGVASPNSPATEFMIADAGIGVSEQQVEQFLTTVGASSKGGELGRSRRTYIGQFGIGLLSCFLVADEITVVSRSATGTDAIQWVGRSDGTYTVETLTDETNIGTTVRLRPRPDMIGWARSEQVIPLARKYAEFLPVQLKVLTNTGAQYVSRTWRRDFDTHRAAIMRGIPPVFGGVGVAKQFDAVEVHDDALGLDGVVYIGTTAGRSKSVGRNRIYVNDMLVDDADSALLPSWAFFAWAAINSTELEPTASRESIMSNTTLTTTRHKLGQAAVGWLRSLADSDPQRFAEFVADNNLELRSAATQGNDDTLELAEVVLPQLTMQTTEGALRLVDVVQRNPNILYAVSDKEFRTIASFNPGGRIVVNAGHTLDQEVLLMLPQVMPGVTVTRAYPASEVAALADAPADTEAVPALEIRGAAALAASGCRVAVRQFPSTALPAVFVGHGQIDVASPGYGNLTHLVLNWGNRAVRALTRTNDDLVFERLMQLLYVQARMAAQCDGPEDRVLLSAALDDIIVLAAGVDGTEVGR